MAQADLPKALSGDNLAFTHQEAITSIVRLRSARQVVSDAQHFRQQFIDALKLAQEQGRARGYTDEETRDGRFAVVAFLDETVLNLRTPVFADWVRKPLQEELFGTHTGGELFFQKIDSLMRQPDSQHLADVLEIYLLCLTLGYAGKYSASGRGELMSFKQDISSRISRIRGPEKDISPRWRPEAAVHLSTVGDPWLKPLLYTAISCFVLVLVLFAVYKLSLHSSISSTVANEAQRAQDRAAEQVRNQSVEAASACPFCASSSKAQRAQDRAAEQVRNRSVEAASACPFCAGSSKAQRAQDRAAEQVRNQSVEAASACPFCASSVEGVRVSR